VSEEPSLLALEQHAQSITIVAAHGCRHYYFLEMVHFAYHYLPQIFGYFEKVLYLCNVKQ